MRKYKNKAYLRYQYIDLKRSANEIALELDCSRYTIYRWLKRFKIPRRTLKEIISDKKRLTDEQKKERMLEMIKQADKLIAEGRALLKESRLSPTAREQLRLKEGYKQKKKELEELRRKIKIENERVSGSWEHDEVEEQMYEIMEHTRDKI